VIVFLQKNITYIYVGFLCLFNLLNYFLIGPIQWVAISLNTFLNILLVIFIASVYFILDFIILHIIRHKILILDIPYILKGKVRLIPFSVSLIVAMLEELLYRFYLLQVSETYVFICLIIGSIYFGLVHISFSKYDMYSKMVLGIVCGILLIVSKNLLYSIIFHFTYNYFALKDKGGLAVGN
jgi:uncharacterized protein